jgi:hypothetical protein
MRDRYVELGPLIKYRTLRQQQKCPKIRKKVVDGTKPHFSDFSAFFAQNKCGWQA